ncbi:MAG TPA: serine/threonine-protein phosphatase [Planctomycetaceae bacterium]|nr:serine/threonine-protein phosphatase [Planctomycetaceae bacterium]
MRRSNNQDAHASVKADSLERFTARGHLFVVADGMGAHAAGELASRIAAEQIPLYYLRKLSGDPIEALRDAVQQANFDIHQRGQQNHEFHNMGTTASSLAILPEGAVVAHVGDSRVYRVRGDKLEQLTFDHSLVWEMEASGQVKAESQLGSSIPKNIITRSLGPSPSVLVDVEGPFPIKPGDRFLLCSDGLTGQIEDDEIGPLLSCLSPELAARILVDLANLRGGPDNITVIVVEVIEHEAAPSAPRIASPTAAAVPWPIVGSAAFCAIAGAMLGLGGNIGPMVVALILATIATVISIVQYRRRMKWGTPNSQTGHRSSAHRSGPYRSCSAKPTVRLLEKLDQVLVALKSAAVQRNWEVDWQQVDALIQQEQQLRSQGKLAMATQVQSQAIIATMKQLRNQQRTNERG